ncbi:sugar phosphate isomerase/epimerase family protein [Streptomyces sp. NPDC050418]|uniref:sugar phosphate isomerase/epimerase family protein n=1 Tax=Streptomyces sp. NPDC050418 TaxID=3365612 RepID=UPI003790B141
MTLQAGQGAAGPAEGAGALLPPGAGCAPAPLVGLVDWRLPCAGPAALEVARRAGADGVQFDLGGPGRAAPLDGPGRLPALRDGVEATGVRVLAVSANCLNDIGLLAPEGSADAVRVRGVLERLLDAAVELGAGLVLVPSFRRSAIAGGYGLQRTAEVLRRAAAEAQARGLLLANENVLPPDAASALVEKVASPAFRLLLDTYNPHLAGVRVPSLIGAVARHLADQIHLKDGIAGTGRTPLLGDGDGEVDETLAAVARHGLCPRALVLENDYRDGDTTRMAADLARARRYARALATGPAGPGAAHRGIDDNSHEKAST